MKIVIPLKTNSERILNKNLKPFYNGLSLFDVKIRQLLKVFSPNDIFVSSNDKEKVEKICKNYKINFLLRDLYFTYNSTPWHEVVSNIINNIPEDDIMWVQVTQPLFNEFKEVKEKWEDIKDNYDSLAVVRKISHHIINENFQPLNFNFGYWHKISQDLAKYYEITWACFCAKYNMIKETGYQIGRKPFLYETKKFLVDIDTEDEFEVARNLFSFLQ